VPEKWDGADFVLSRFDAAERETMEEVIARAADGAECWVTEGTPAAMNRYN
jgi:peptidyl-tRNA hydrolase, PTH1 family